MSLVSEPILVRCGNRNYYYLSYQNQQQGYFSSLRQALKARKEWEARLKGLPF